MNLEIPFSIGSDVWVVHPVGLEATQERIESISVWMDDAKPMTISYSFKPNPSHRSLLQCTVLGRTGSDLVFATYEEAMAFQNKCIESMRKWGHKT